jgi:hypothetical protein
MKRLSFVFFYLPPRDDLRVRVVHDFRDYVKQDEKRGVLRCTFLVLIDEKDNFFNIKG